VDAAAHSLPAPLPTELTRVDATRLPIGTLLLRDGVLSAEQLEAALALM
jgi:hypothetical protein